MLARIAAVVVLLCLGTASVEAQTAPLTITSTSATVHKAPSVAAPVIGHASRGDVLTVTRDVGDWVKVVWPSDPSGAGYVRESLGYRGRPAAGTQASLAPSATPDPVRRAGGASVSTDTRPNVAEPQSVGAPIRTGRPAYVSRPSHVVGLGARMAGPPLGIGGSFRAWSPGWLGLQVDFSRYSVSTPLDPTSMNTTQFAPSVLLKPTDMISDYVWLRPYAGAGFAMYRSTLNSPTIGVTATDNRTGFQFFGGAEFTAASLPAVGVSLDYGFRTFESPFAGFDFGGSSVTIAAHWYVK